MSGCRLRQRKGSSVTAGWDSDRPMSMTIQNTLRKVSLDDMIWSTHEFIINVVECKSMLQLTKSPHTSHRAAHYLNLIRQKLETSERRVSWLTKCISEEMENLTSQVSKSQDDVAMGVERSDKKEEEVRAYLEAKIHADVMCLRYLQEIDKAEAEMIAQTELPKQASRLARLAVNLGIVVLTGLVGLAVYHFFSYRNAKNAEAARLQRLKDASMRLQDAECVFEKYRDFVEQCNALYAEASRDLEVTVSAKVRQKLRQDWLTALQKFIFSVGKRYKEASTLLRKVTGQAEVAEFMLDYGTIQELDRLLKEMATTFQNFESVLPALSF